MLYHIFKKELNIYVWTFFSQITILIKFNGKVQEQLWFDALLTLYSGEISNHKEISIIKNQAKQILK